MMAGYDKDIFGDSSASAAEFEGDIFPARPPRVSLSVSAEKKPSESLATQEGRASILRGLHSALQGPTLGFSDEILGGLGAVGKTLVNNASFIDNYREMRDYYRGAADQAGKDAKEMLGDVAGPVFTGATQLAAAAPLSVVRVPAALEGTKVGAFLQRLLPTATVPGGVGANAARAATLGATSGAIRGAGESEKDGALGLAIDSLSGAALGGVLGGGASIFGSGMGGMYDVGKSYLSGSAAERYARQKVAEALVRDARGGAVQNNAPAISGQVTARLGKLGDEARLVDAGGQNTRQLLDTLATLPGKTKADAERAILERQVGRADRLRDSAQASLGQSGARLAPTVEGLLEQRSRDAAPLYEALYKRGVFINEELRGVIDAANKLGAGGEAKKIATAKQRDYSLTPDTQWAGIRDLDYLKQGLDDIIAANKNEFGRLNKVGAAVQSLKDDLVAILDQETKGLYKKARDAYAGPSALIDAAQSGRRVWASDDTSIAQAMQGLSQSELDSFRLGAFEALRSKLGNMGGQNEILRMWRDKTTSEKLRAIFGNERNFREFASTVGAENRLKGLESVGRGSQTAARQYGAGDLDSSAVTEVIKTAAGPTSMASIMSGAANVWNKVKTPEAVRDRMGSMLLQRNPSAAITMQQIEREMMRVANERAMTHGLLGLGSSQVAAPVSGGLLSGF